MSSQFQLCKDDPDEPIQRIEVSVSLGRVGCTRKQVFDTGFTISEWAEMSLDAQQEHARVYLYTHLMTWEWKDL